MAASPAGATTARELDQAVDRTVADWRARYPRAVPLGERARGALVFPSIIKAGLLVGGQTGEGALRVAGRTRGHYRLVAGSYGLQAGAQRFSMLMLMMNEAALKFLDESDGWQVGVGPSFVVADQNFARTVTTTTVTQDVVVFIFGQRGLMAGVGIEGSKISRITLR